MYKISSTRITPLTCASPPISTSVAKFADNKSIPKLELNIPFTTKSPWNGSSLDAIGSVPLSG